MAGAAAAQGTMNFGNCGLGGAMSTYGGLANPICNYHSPLAKKFIYKEMNQVFRPLRRHIFRMKVKTAAELRIHEVVKKYMIRKTQGQVKLFGATFTNQLEYPNMSWIIPKDEHEIKKLTSFMTSQKMSDDYKELLNYRWRKVLFSAECHNYVGWPENSLHQNNRPGTDEEWMTLMWFQMFVATIVAFALTLLYWWWKWGQAPQYVEIK